MYVRILTVSIRILEKERWSVCLETQKMISNSAHKSVVIDWGKEEGSFSQIALFLRSSFFLLQNKLLY